MAEDQNDDRAQNIGEEIEAANTKIADAARKAQAAGERVRHVAENFCDTYYADIRVPLRKASNTLKKLGKKKAAKRIRRLMARIEEVCPRPEAVQPETDGQDVAAA